MQPGELLNNVLSPILRAVVVEELSGNDGARQIDNVASRRQSFFVAPAVFRSGDGRAWHVGTFSTRYRLDQIIRISRIVLQVSTTSGSASRCVGKEGRTF